MYNICTYVRMSIHAIDNVFTIYGRIDIHMYLRTYSTAQFKVDRSHVWHGLNSTHFLFYT